MKKINILWTGGWDSTFRLLQLIDKSVIIQPYYLKCGRPSEEIEIKTINSILRLIEKNKKTNCQILNTLFKSVSDIAEDREISSAYYRLCKKDFLGDQYEWLARFAKTVRGLELAIHRDDKAYAVIKNNGKIKIINDEIYGKYSVVDVEESSNDVLSLFQDYHFPLLNITKLEMKKWAEQNKLIDILDQTWFCHKPINGAPCGECNPCKYTIEEGMIYRFDKEALKRYKRRKKKEAIKNTFIYRGLRSIYRTVKS